MGFQYIDPHAEIPLFKVALASAKELFGKALSFGAGVIDGVAEITHSAVAGVADMASSVGLSAPAREVAPVQQAKIEAPQVEIKRDTHHVDMADLGSFAPPSFGGGSMSQGIGGRS